MFYFFFNNYEVRISLVPKKKKKHKMNVIRKKENYPLCSSLNLFPLLEFSKGYLKRKVIQLLR